MRRMVEGASIIFPLRLALLATTPASGGGTAPSAPGMMIFVQSPGGGEGSVGAAAWFESPSPAPREREGPAPLGVGG
jgi:hypothetical protein